MRRIATDVWRDRLVCLSTMQMYPAKTAGPIEMPFDTWAGVDPSNLRRGPNPSGKAACFGMPMVGIFDSTMRRCIEFLRSLVSI